MSDVSPAEFDRMLGESLAALRTSSAAPTAEAVAEEPVLRGEGEALDGLVRVVALPGGRMESVTVEPKALRAGSEALSAALLEAVNASLADLQSRIAAALPAAPDTAALTGQLQELQDRSIRTLGTFLDAVEDLRVQTSRRKGRADG